MAFGSLSNKWKIDVRFRSKGVIEANATGLLLVPPEDALALVTHEAGDELFRVVQRTVLPSGKDGIKRVEVVNKAAIRVLAWKLWTFNRVVYEVHQPTPAPETECTCAASKGLCNCSCSCSSSAETGSSSRRVTFKLVSSNMLHSLSGTWKLDPVKIHTSSLPAAAAAAAAQGSISRSTLASKPAAAAHSLKPDGYNGVQMLAAAGSSDGVPMMYSSSSSSGGSSSSRPNPLPVDADGNITATLVTYEQLAQPKGLPPGIRFMPGISDAVRMSVGREVRQMMDKITYAATLEVHHGLNPQSALRLMTQQLKEAGGSFKKLIKFESMDMQATPGATAATATEAARASSHDFAVGETRLPSKSGSNSSILGGKRRPGQHRVVNSEDARQENRFEVQSLSV